jgi:hypothetical protein
MVSKFERWNVAYMYYTFKRGTKYLPQTKMPVWMEFCMSSFYTVELNTAMQASQYNRETRRVSHIEQELCIVLYIVFEGTCNIMNIFFLKCAIQRAICMIQYLQSFCVLTLILASI